MNTKNFVVGVMGCVAVSIGASAAQPLQPSQPLTVDEVIHRVVDEYPAVEQAKTGVDAARARTLQARSALLPQVDAMASYRRVDPVAKVTLPLGPEPQSFSFAPNNNYETALQLQQLLFDFGRSQSRVDAAKSAEKTANLNVDKIKRDLAYQTARLFYGILFLRQRIGVEDEQIATYRENLSITQKKVDAGSATNFDLLTTRVRLATAENQKIDTIDALKQQEAGLRALLGFTPRDTLSLKGDFSNLPDRPDVDALLDSAVANRVETRLAASRVESAQRQLDTARLNDKPKIGADVSAGFKNGYMPDLNGLKANWTFGVSVSVPVFNGHETAGKQQEAAAGLRGAQAATETTDREIREEVVKAAADVNAALDKLGNMKTLVEQAREALRLAQIRYQNGTATNLELLDAQTSLSEAELSSLQARYASVLSRYTLDRAAGRLSY